MHFLFEQVSTSGCLMLFSVEEQLSREFLAGKKLAGTDSLEKGASQQWKEGVTVYLEIWRTKNLADLVD